MAGGRRVVARRAARRGRPGAHRRRRAAAPARRGRRCCARRRPAARSGSRPRARARRSRSASTSCSRASRPTQVLDADRDRRRARAGCCCPTAAPPLGERARGRGARRRRSRRPAAVRARCSARSRRTPGGCSRSASLDMRAAALPERFDEALAVARGTSRATARRGSLAAPARALRPDVAAWCERLARRARAGEPRPQRPAPVERPPRRRAGADASTTGATASSRTRSRACCVPLTVHGARVATARRRRSCASATPTSRSFADLAPHAELVETLELACRPAKVARALTWEWVIGALAPQDVRDEWRRAPLECLRSLTRGLVPRRPLRTAEDDAGATCRRRRRCRCGRRPSC